MAEQVVLGIDVAKETLDVVVQVGQAKSYGQFDNNTSGFNQLRGWLMKANVKVGRACLEATGIYGDALAMYLHETGWVVHVVNPARISAYAKSQMKRAKTDRIDAYLIADYAARHELPVWHPPSPQQQRLREFIRHIENLKTLRETEVKRLATVSDPVVRASSEQLIAFVGQQIEALIQQMQDHIDQYPELGDDQDLLDSIPGIGPWTAARLIAEIPDIERFNSAKELVAYAGLNPTVFVSGTSVRGQSRISKMGNAHIRDALYMVAWSAKQHDPRMRAFYEGLVARGKCKQVAVVAVMRKLLHLVYAILTSRTPFDPNYASSGA